MLVLVCGVGVCVDVEISVGMCTGIVVGVVVNCRMRVGEGVEVGVGETCCVWCWVDVSYIVLT